MPYKCGFVAIIGRPNVGKSTLMNHLIRQKISITSKRAQTTRQAIKGIYTDDTAQLIFIDTPGLLNSKFKELYSPVEEALQEADSVLFVSEARQFTPVDGQLLKLIPSEKKAILVINKMDRDKYQASKEPSFIEPILSKKNFVSISFVSAKHALGLTALTDQIKTLLPEGPPLYPEDMLSDQPTRFLVAEILREKIFRFVGEEIPYAVEVMINRFQEGEKLIEVDTNFLVPKDSYKGILISTHGRRLKKIASEARLDIERLLGKKVMLKTWVKVRQHIHQPKGF